LLSLLFLHDEIINATNSNVVILYMDGPDGKTAKAAQYTTTLLISINLDFYFLIIGIKKVIFHNVIDPLNLPKRENQI
jgi:hypothetical protein